MERRFGEAGGLTVSEAIKLLAKSLIASCFSTVCWIPSSLSADLDTIYRDENFGYAVLRLGGWKVDAPQPPSNANEHYKFPTRFKAPDFSVTGEACVVIISKLVETRHVSQTDLNAAMRDRRRTNSELTEIQHTDPSARLVSDKTRDTNGIAEIDSEILFHRPTTDGPQIPQTVRSLTVMIPGYGYSVVCTAKNKNYAASRSDFDRIFQSFKITKR
jgi:hypothetical protein